RRRNATTILGVANAVPGAGTIGAPKCRTSAGRFGAKVHRLLLDLAMQLLWSPEERVLIHAEGLVLREWTYEDVPVMVGLFDTDEMNQWTPLPSPFNNKVAERYVDAPHQLRAQTGALQLAITEDACTPLGEVLAFPGSSENSVELAYAVGADHQGRGLARRAILAALALATRAGATEAELVISMDNVCSQRVARATGFHRSQQPLTQRRRKGFLMTIAAWERTLS
ncbi:MAG: GNAT family N-acetyltransferase, partial [Candidatus Nanopelagicales bacterium]